MESTSAVIRYELKASVAKITVANLKVNNAIDYEAMEQLEDGVKRALADSSCRVLVLQAEGEDFIRGLDLEWAFAEGRRPDTEQFRKFANCLHLLHTGRLPVIACVEGNVTAGGLGLISACDIVLANPEVKFILSEIIVGMIPPIGMPFLLRRVGVSRAKYLALSTRSLTATEAQGIGLVDEVAQTGMKQALKAQIQRLLRSSPKAIAELKSYFVQLDEGSLERQKKMALDLACAWVAQPDVAEGIQAFAEGFAPPWFEKYKG
jgi:methylglutaconyl-CoA hydratase/polyketide biosynthesis enoyl-CoA hydratase PksH